MLFAAGFARAVGTSRFGAVFGDVGGDGATFGDGGDPFGDGASVVALGPFAGDPGALGGAGGGSGRGGGGTALGWRARATTRAVASATAAHVLPRRERERGPSALVVRTSTT